MKETIKAAEIIDFFRDIDDGNHYRCSIWTEFDFWGLEFTLKNNMLENIVLYDEEDANRRYRINEPITIEGSAKNLLTVNGEFELVLTEQFFENLEFELAALAEQDRLEENTYVFYSLPALVAALKNKEPRKYYEAEITEPVIVSLDRKRLKQTLSEQMMKEIEELTGEEMRKERIKKDDADNYLFFTEYILNIFIADNKVEVRPLIDYAFGPIDFPDYHFNYVSPADVANKVGAMIAVTLAKYDQFIHEDLLYCDTLNYEDEVRFDDEEESDYDDP